ncbi:MAG: hypothetical protein JNL43_00075 [Flavobacteriales bacterium]|nr:hypothetical protein [Flavobacteriales bacterium]
MNRYLHWFLSLHLLFGAEVLVHAQYARTASLVKSFTATTDLSHFSTISSSGTPRLFFIRKDGPLGTGELWWTDGAGTTKQVTLASGSVVAAKGSSKYIYFLTADRKLFRIDDLVKPVELPVSSSGTIDLGWAAEANGKLFFKVAGTSKVELWTTDGTAANTKSVKVLMSGDDFDAQGSPPVGNAVALPNGKVYFCNRNVPMGTEVWVSNGTSVGTAALKDVVVGSGASNPINLQVAGSKLFFTADKRVWTSDGTTAGTIALSATDVSSTTNKADHFVAQDQGIYFAAQWSENGFGWADRNLRFWNGTSYFTPTGKHQAPHDLVSFVSDICFIAGANSTQILRVVGHNVTPWVLAEEASPATRLMLLGRKLFYLVKSPNGTQYKMMYLDPEVNPRVRLVVQPTTAPVEYAIAPKTGAANNLLIVGSTLYFAANYTGNGTCLYKTW